MLVAVFWMRCDSIGGTTVVLVNKGFFGRWYTCWHSRDSRNSWHEATMNFCECLRIRIHLSHFWWTAWTRPYSYCLGKGVLTKIPRNIFGHISGEIYGLSVIDCLRPLWYVVGHLGHGGWTRFNRNNPRKSVEKRVLKSVPNFGT